MTDQMSVWRMDWKMTFIKFVVNNEMYDVSGSQVGGDQDDINQFDKHERHQNAAQPVNEHVVAQDDFRAERPVLDAFEGQRDQRHDDEGVEDDGAEDGALGRVQVHDVELVQRPPAARGGGVEEAEHGGKNGEIFRHIVGDAEGRQRAARHEELFADFHHFDELGRIAVEIDHVPGFARGLGARVHGDANVGLGQGGGVVGAVADHGDQLAAVLFLADAGQFVFRRGLGDEIIHARLSGDGGGGEGIIARDHDGLDSHFSQLGKALLDSAFDNVLEADDAEGALAVAHHQRSAAGTGNFLHGVHQGLINLAAVLDDKEPDRFRRALTNPANGLGFRRGFRRG